jgi:hypothetical protein
MKLLGCLFCALVTTSAFAALPKLINCENDRGLVLEMSLTPYEASKPIYNLKLKYQDKVVKSFQATLTSNSSSKLEVQAQDDEDRLMIYAGYKFQTKEGYYQEAANNGMSPLPSQTFKKCAIR